MSHLILDIATAPLPNAAEFITLDDISAPANYKDPEKIQAFCEAERQKRLEKCGLDADLCRLTAMGYEQTGGDANVLVCRTEQEERDVLHAIGVSLQAQSLQLVTFNGFKFDLPILLRRAQYLGVKMPPINLDKYRSSHVDLYDRLTHHGAIAGHSLSWYVKRHGWSDLVKPLTGEEEARVPETGKWDELAQSVRHDLEATKRLAQWMGVL